jgi:excisionase family DNA binding protein
VAVRDEALAGSTPRRRPAADRDRVTSVLDEQHNGRLGISVALAEHGHRQPDVGQHPAGIKEEAARILKVAVRYIDRCVVERRIRFVKLGRYIRIPRSAIDEYVARCTVDARPAELAGSRLRQIGAR